MPRRKKQGRIRTFLIGIFEEEHVLLQAVEAIRRAGFELYDVFSPYAVHGLDDAMGLRHSRLPRVTFIAGAVGLILAVAFQFWSSVFDWPIDVGGKPPNSGLAFLPVAFEITVLLGGLATVAAFFLRDRLYPGAREVLLDRRVTDDKFAVVLERKDAGFDEEMARRLFAALGASEINEQVLVL